MGGGDLLIFIGGSLKWKISLEDLPDQSFLSPGGSTLYVTPVELVGRQEVRATLSLKREVDDQDESNNMLSKIFEREVVPVLPPPIPDPAITDLFISPKKRVGVTIANLGDGIFELEHGDLKLFVDGHLKKEYPLRELTNQGILSPKGKISLILPYTLTGRHEVQAFLSITGKEPNQENNQLRKILEILPSGPDITVNNLELTEDLELLVILSNEGELDLRKGTTFRVRIWVNDQKVSEFDHYIFAPIKAHSGSHYILEPPYRISITGISRIKVTVLPRYPSDDIRLENNMLEKTIIIYPFRVEGLGKEEYSFIPSSPKIRGDEKIKAEMRWEGKEGPLMLSFQPPWEVKEELTISGRSPLKMEIPISTGLGLKEKPWKISITNFRDKKIRGHLIVQYP